MKLGISRLAIRKRPALPGLLLTAAVLLLAVSTARATTSGMPWDTAFNQILSALTGSVAHVIGVVAIFGTGVGMAFSEGGSMMRKALWVVLGLTIAFNAGTWGLTFLGLSGGLVV
jgi:type IV secretion system protein VirB2